MPLLHNASHRLGDAVCRVSPPKEEAIWYSSVNGGPAGRQTQRTKTPILDGDRCFGESRPNTASATSSINGRDGAPCGMDGFRLADPGDHALNVFESSAGQAVHASIEHDLTVVFFQPNITAR